uniref:Uncharacterized protein n=1 Tax=Arundo donax TaxID=35708 RepID=A0A0A9CWA0_ARUDO
MSTLSNILRTTLNQQVMFSANISNNSQLNAFKLAKKQTNNI